MLAAYTGTADNWVGDWCDQGSIAAVVLGGAVIGGGICTVSGTILETLKQLEGFLLVYSPLHSYELLLP
jgi:ribose/xylose/arabinose/galactoside ABC-type transport system permease subunit